MPRLDFLIPGDPGTATGGYIYDRRIVQGLRRLGWDTQVQTLDGSFPRPTRQALDQARAVLARMPPGGLVMIDGLAMGAMPDVVAPEAQRLRLIALVHHPLAAETGLSEERARALRLSERRALETAFRVIATSRYTGGLLIELGVPAERIDVVEPGTDPAPLAQGAGSARLRLLCVATLTHRKGHAVLFEALGGLKDRDWRLTCAGSMDLNPETVAALRAQLERLGLSKRVALLGEVGEATLSELYARSDLFVLATRFEGYGMALAEALARGLPIVSTRTGAVSQTVPEGAGLLVPPNDPKSLAEALARIMADADLRLRLSEGARQAREGLPTWEVACAKMARVLATAAP